MSEFTQALILAIVSNAALLAGVVGAVRLIEWAERRRWLK